MTTHRVGVREAFLVSHKLKLVGLSSGNTEGIREDIEALLGVDSVNLNLENSTIRIAYDASKLNIDEMRDIFRQHGADVSPVWWNQWKLSWDQQIDQNVKDNANHQAVCCNKAPTNYKTRK